MKFTDEQLAIIKHGEGHAKVAAVAGSGKSSTMIERIAYLVEVIGVDPNLILSVMFNKSARDEFEEKLKKRLGTLFRQGNVKTFHSLGLDICKLLTKNRYLPKYTIETRDWVLYDMAKESLIRVTGESYIDKGDVESFVEFIDVVKSDVLTVRDKKEDAEKTMGKDIKTECIEAYEVFEEIRKERQLRFFADLIYDPVMVLMNNKKAEECVKSHVQHIIIDEYQDINESQQILMTMIAGDRSEVMVVGDEDQCIYSWRGAKPEYMKELFDVDFRNPVKYTLSYTFRYGHCVSLLANHVISKNTNREDSLCLSHHSTPHTQIYRHGNDNGHRKVCEIIKEHKRNEGKYSDIAVLFRQYGSAAKTEIEMIKDGIPYEITSGKPVFSRREAELVMGLGELVRQGIDYLIYGEDRVISLFEFPSMGVKKDVIVSLCNTLRHHTKSEIKDIDYIVKSINTSDWVKQKLCRRISALKMFSENIKRDDSSEKLFDLMSRSLDVNNAIVKMSRGSDDAQESVDVLDAFRSLGEGKTVDELMGFMDRERGRSNDGGLNKGDKVLISSMHKTKGLEFPVVIMPELHVKDLRLPKEQEEAERRVFYVGITRCQKELHLIHPVDNELEDRMEAGFNKVPDDVALSDMFLYESNFEVAKKTGEIIYTEGMGNDEVTIETEEDALLTRYMKDCGCEVKTSIVKSAFDAGKRKQLVCGKGVRFSGSKGMKVFSERYGSGVIDNVIARKETFIVECTFGKGMERTIAANIEKLYKEETVKVSRI